MARLLGEAAPVRRRAGRPPPALLLGLAALGAVLALAALLSNLWPRGASETPPAAAAPAAVTAELRRRDFVRELAARATPAPEAPAGSALAAP
jgi:hypothetical protein